LTRQDLVDYFGKEYLGLNAKVISEVLETIRNALPEWNRLIGICFLGTGLKANYVRWVEDRCARLFSAVIPIQSR
jgi:hypothetical protein